MVKSGTRFWQRYPHACAQAAPTEGAVSDHGNINHRFGEPLQLQRPRGAAIAEIFRDRPSPVEVETNFAVDTLRFPDAERRRIAESLFRPERTEDQLMEDDVLRSMLETVDAVFSITAEETADRENISLEDAQEGMWALFEAGFIRLVSHSDSMGIELCLSRNERRAAAKKNKLLANYRRRIGEGALDRGGTHPARVWAGI